MKVLLLGSAGQVGRACREVLAKAGFQLAALNRRELDVSDRQAVDVTLEASTADVAINAAAFTAVDLAEAETDRAWSANRDGPGYLAAACARRRIPLIHLSTDYVFDGEKTGAYCEEDPPRPLSVYGKSKWEGEQAIRQRLEEHLIFRTSWVFAAHGRNFVNTMLRLGAEKPAIRVVADQKGCPTYAPDLAEALLTVLNCLASTGALPWGTYHYCGWPPTSWHDFAKCIVQEAWARGRLSRRPEIVPVTSAEYGAAAQRPRHSVLDCTKGMELLSLGPRPWPAGLVEILSHPADAGPTP